TYPNPYAAPMAPIRARPGSLFGAVLTVMLPTRDERDPFQGGSMIREMSRKMYGRGGGVAMIVAGLALAGGCNGSGGGTAWSADELRGTIGPDGGQLIGQPGTPFEGVDIIVPAGALSASTEISIKVAKNDPALPPAAHACGSTFSISPDGLELTVPAVVT